MSDDGFGASLSRVIYPLGRGSTLHPLNFALSRDTVAGPVSRGALLAVRLRREKRAPTPSLWSDFAFLRCSSGPLRATPRPAVAALLYTDKLRGGTLSTVCAPSALD